MAYEKEVLNLIKEADFETLLQMEGFLSEEEDLRDVMYHKVDMIIHRINKKVDDKAEKLSDLAMVFMDLVDADNVKGTMKIYSRIHRFKVGGTK